MPEGSISEKVRYQMLKDTFRLFEGVSKNKGYHNSPDLIPDYNDSDPKDQAIIQKLRQNVKDKLEVKKESNNEIDNLKNQTEIAKISFEMKNSKIILPSISQQSEFTPEEYNFKSTNRYSGIISKQTQRILMPGKKAYNDKISQIYSKHRESSVTNHDSRQNLNDTQLGIRQQNLGYKGITNELHQQSPRSMSVMEKRFQKPDNIRTLNKTELLKSQIEPNYKEFNYFKNVIDINIDKEQEKLDLLSQDYSVDQIFNTTDEKYNQINQQEKRLKQLQIMTSLAKSEKKGNLNIQKIKQLRRDAINQRYNSNNTQTEQLSSRAMVNDLNALISPKKQIRQQPGKVQQQIQNLVLSQNKEKRINKLANLIKKNNVPSPETYLIHRVRKVSSSPDSISSQKSLCNSNRVQFDSFSVKKSQIVSKYQIPKKIDPDKLLQLQKVELFSDNLKQLLGQGQSDVLDPDISDEERQIRYKEFKSYHMKRLNTLVKKYKKKHRIENPDEYDSDDSLTSLFEENQPRRMFGKLAKDKTTGKSYKIPSVEQIKKILMDNVKTTAQIVDLLIPGDISLKDQLCAIAIMQNHKLITENMLLEIKKREDKLSQYINFITGHDVFSGGHGALSSDKMFTHGLSRHLSKSFQNYVDFCDNSASRVANALVSKLKYFKKCKTSANPKIREELQSDPHFNYYSQCQSEMELALPILEKVHNKTLSLYDYTLSQVSTQALEQAAKFFENFVNRILLDNCGVTDSQFSKMVLALSSLQDFKSITYRRNDFGMESANAVLGLTDRKVPYQLEQLRIQNCRIASSTTVHLLQNLIKKSYLSKLSLVEANLNTQSMSLLCEFIKTNKFIDHIDISWNKMSPQHFVDFLKLIKSNRKIKFLNLSWNQLIQIKKINIWDLKKNPKLILEQPIKPRLTDFDLESLSDDGKVKALEEEERNLATESERFVSECLCDFIKYNPHLHHIDLQGTGLTEYILRQIARALRKSRSLVGIHLSENPGLSPEIKEYIIKRVHCKESDFKNLRVVDISKFEYALKKTDMKVNHRMFQDSILLREIIARKRCEQAKTIIGVQKAERTCNLIRYNGHKNEMPGKSGQWQMLMDEHENCWICDKWTYSLVFFNPGKIQAANPWDQCEDLKSYLIKQLMLFHGDTSFEDTIESDAESIDLEKSDEKIEIFASFTNWKPKKMMPFLDFISIIDKDKPDFLHQLRIKRLIRVSVQNTEDLNPQEYEQYQKLVNEYKITLKNEKWEKVLQKNLKYKKPAILNLMPNELHKPERLYVLPIFIKSGKHNMIIKHRDNEMETLDWVYERGIVDFRVEDIIHYTKILKSHLKIRKFEKDKSVFKDWIEDTPQTYQKCLEHDIGFWKVTAKLKLDSEDLANVEQVLEDNFAVLKSIYIFLISSSDYPGSTMVDFTRFIKTCRLGESSMDSTRFDQLFLQAIQELDTKKESIKIMKRWKFLEFMIRLAKDKYVDQKKIEKTFAGALKRLIRNNFLEIWDELKVTPWQEFRFEFVWTLEISDLFDSNLEGLQLVFSKFCNKQKLLKFSDAIKMFTQSQVQLSETQTKFCYGMSKMTIVEEFVSSDKQGYGVMQFVEFLEMICRVGVAKFKGTEYANHDLVHKVIFIVDDLLAIVGQERKEVNIEAEEISESDEDY